MQFGTNKASLRYRMLYRRINDTSGMKEFLGKADHVRRMVYFPDKMKKSDVLSGIRPL